jgi:arabinose-5-phosphate isomerase
VFNSVQLARRRRLHYGFDISISLWTPPDFRSVGDPLGSPVLTFAAAATSAASTPTDAGAPAGDSDIIAHGRQVIATEMEGLRQLAAMLDESFARAVALLHAATGRIAVTGVGKSGQIGRKIASTLASTGTPAYFLHPLEAAHGDLGMMASGDVAIVISNSGESRALRPIVDHAHRIGVPVIAIASRAEAPLMRAAQVALLLPAAPEACALGVAPSTSTTATLALGDALAIALMRVRNFSREGFGMLHPGGAMGLKLSRVAALMHAGDRIPLVAEDADGQAILNEINVKGFGVTGVVDASGALTGVITDGDIRRNVSRIETATAAEIMHRGARTIDRDAPADAALTLMREHRISCLFVMAADSPVPAGFVHLHDFLRAGLA